MSFMRSMFMYFKKLFVKENERKVLALPIEDKQLDFKNSIKLDKPIEQRKKRIETLVCVGDGLGIQPKIKF